MRAVQKVFDNRLLHASATGLRFALRAIALCSGGCRELDPPSEIKVEGSEYVGWLNVRLGQVSYTLQYKSHREETNHHSCCSGTVIRALF